MAYASLSELRAFLRLASGETTDDTLLTNLLTYAQAFIESPQCCNRVFEASADTTRYFDAVEDTDGARLNFDTDCAAITAVTNGGAVVVPSTAYVTLPANQTPYIGIQLLASKGYTWQFVDDPENAISIAGKWAYSTTAPSAIKDATLVLGKWMYRQLNSDSDTDRPIISPDGTMLMPTALPRMFWDLVNGYRRRSL